MYKFFAALRRIFNELVFGVHEFVAEILFDQVGFQYNLRLLK